MIKEQVAQELHWYDWDCEVSMAYNYGTSGSWDEQDDILKEFYLKRAEAIHALYLSKFKEIVEGITEISWDEATSNKEMTQEEIFHCEQLATIGIDPSDKDAEGYYNANYEFAVKAMQRYLTAQVQLHHSQQEILNKLEEMGK